MRPRMRRVAFTKASIFRVALQSIRWTFALLGLALRLGWDRFRKKKDVQRAGVHVRRMFENMGGVAIKLGQQLSARVDLLPFEVCQELGTLLDAFAPFDVSVAKKRLEALTGRPVEELFEEIDPKPIGSASIACVFKAKLKTGELVAIKVKRPGVDREFMADLTFVDWGSRLLEILTVVRPNLFRYLRTELSEMLLDELDLRKEATYQFLFRRYVKQDRLDWVTAPRVFPELSGDDVLTTELVEGITCTQLLSAIETKNQAELDKYKAMGIEPRTVGWRIMTMSLWARHERPFFHSDPHPGNILIERGGRLVMLDFGSCGVMSRKNVQHSVEMYRRFVMNDVTGCATVVTGLLAPLPLIDIDEFAYQVEHKIFRYYMGVFTKDSEWWERTTAKLWVNMLELTREFGLPVNLEVLRLMRATLLYDTLACRIHPKITIQRAFRRWKNGAGKRARRRNRKRLGRQNPRRIENRAAALAKDSAEIIGNGAFFFSNIVRDAPLARIPMIGKGAFFAAHLLRVGMMFLYVGIAGFGAAAIHRYATGSNLQVSDVIRWILTHPIAVPAIALFFVPTVRRILFRLSDTDES
jgi:ubiquinone biosynthesis protein